MKPLRPINLRSKQTGILSILLLFSISMLIAFSCKRENMERAINNSHTSIEDIRKWWESEKQRKANDVQNIATTTYDINTSIGQWWAGEFENGTPQWNSALTFTVGSGTIYEVPFTFPDGLTMLNYRTSTDVRPFIDIGKPTSKTFLLIYSEAGRAYSSEFMSIVSNVEYMDMLDSTGSPFPDFHITNVFPAPSRLGNFRGSFKFFDVKGQQLMEEKYLDGNIVEYTPYGDMPSTFAMNPVPVTFPIQLTELICWETTHYTTVCGTGEFSNICTTTITSVSVHCTSYSTIDGGGGGIGGIGGGPGGIGGGGTGGGSGHTPAPAITPVSSPKGLSCRSFTFMPGPGNWQEAGLKNYRFKIRLIDPATGYMTGRIINMQQTLYFGLPKVYGDGTVLSPGAAAAKAAQAVNLAGALVIDYYANVMSGVTDAQIQQKFKDMLATVLISAGGTVSVRPTVPNCVVTTTPTYYTFFSDNCE